MCPEAERMLWAMGEEDPRIVPIAFHVDHFNDPLVATRRARTRLTAQPYDRPPGAPSMPLCGLSGSARPGATLEMS
jgi:hypothetical protein